MLIKKILVPVDFSENSENALKYAAELNKKIGAEILIFHSLHIPILATDVPLNVPDEEELRNDALMELDKLKREYKILYPDMLFSTKAELGLAVDEIISARADFDCELVIMGTHGHSGLSELLLGSTTSAVMENAHYLVIAVPQDYHFEGIKTMVFALNYENDDPEKILQTIDLAKIFDSDVVLLHVVNNRNSNTSDSLVLDRFTEKILKESRYPKLKYRLLENEHVYDGIQQCIRETKAEMLTVNMRNRNMIEKMFGRSMTKRLANHINVPLFTFHNQTI